MTAIARRISVAFPSGPVRIEVESGENSSSGEADAMPRRIPGIPKPWQFFGVYVVVFMMLPLVPIGLEKLIVGSVSEQSVTLAAAMYPISIGAVSRSIGLFGIALAITICFAAVFGAVMHEERGRMKTREIVFAKQEKGDSSPVDGVNELKDDAIPYSRILAFVAIGSVILCHVVERYNYHVIDGKSPFEF
jgi:hypothetical protein